MTWLNFLDVLSAWPSLLAGLATTVLLTLISSVLGVALGTLCAWGRLQKAASLRIPIVCYVEFVRNTPFLGQIFFIFFGLPAIGIRMSSFTAAIVALTLNLTAYACEIVRSGIQANPPGQAEAAAALGLRPWQVFMLVVVPPAFQRVWPGLISQLVIILLASALCSQISVGELSYAANVIASRTFRNFESYIVVTVLYLALAGLFREFLTWAGPRFVFGHYTGPAR
jgi:polar amino acid transport system permease protein